VLAWARRRGAGGGAERRDDAPRCGGEEREHRRARARLYTTARARLPSGPGAVRESPFAPRIFVVMPFRA
jgi:hypothetical protein